MKRQKFALPGANGKRLWFLCGNATAPPPGIRPARSNTQIPSRKSPFLRSDEKPPRTANRHDRSFRHGKTCVSGASSARQTRSGFAGGRWNDGIETHGGVRRIRVGSDPSSAYASLSKIEIPTPQHPFGRSRPKSGRRIVPPTFSSGEALNRKYTRRAGRTNRPGPAETNGPVPVKTEGVHASARVDACEPQPPDRISACAFPGRGFGQRDPLPGTRNRRRADRDVGRQPGFGSLPTVRTLRPSMPSKAGRP